VINGLGIDILADTAGVALASNNTVENPNIFVADRWDTPVIHGIPGELVTNIRAVSVNAMGLYGHPLFQQFDPTYDPASGFYLVSTIEYEATASGTTEVFIETNDMTISFAAGKDGALYFGTGDAAVNPYLEDVRSTLADVVITVSYPKGDLSCDGVVNAADINPFVLALTNLPAWQAAHPGVDVLVPGDIGGPGQSTPPFTPDGFFNAQDINPFVYILTHLPPGDIPVPEPASLSLLAAGAVVMMMKRKPKRCRI